MYAIQFGADPGKTTKLTIRGANPEHATEIRIGDPKSTAKILGKGRKVGMPSAQMNLDSVGDSEIDIEVKLSNESPGARCHSH